jgi:hypothetical protein
MSATTVLSKAKIIIANQKTILENQALILQGQQEIRQRQETLDVIVNNQEKILAAQRHCMYRDAVEHYLRSGEIPGATREQLAKRH